MSEAVLEVEGLGKDFGGFRAVDEISFSLRRGSVVGFLGPNGAGKTTSIHMLLGLIRPSRGSIRYFGSDFATNRMACLQRINAASAFNTLLGRITVRENLLVFADLYDVRDPRRVIAGLLDTFEISHLGDTLYWSLSAGQRTRVNLAKALLNDPDVLLMDEPTASLDPDIADKTLSLIEHLRRERGISILYTSHNMAEVARICDDVIFLDHGRIVAHDTPARLTKEFKEATLVLSFTGGRDGMAEYLRRQRLDAVFVTDHCVEVSSKEDRIPELLFGLSHLSGTITDIEIRKPSLEDFFLHIARDHV